MPNVLIDATSLHYEEHGQGEPILGIHGTGSSSVLWRPAAEELGKLGRTILYDRRGFSRSERPEPLVMNVRRHADDAAALLDALAAAPAIVIGRSHGGEIALDLALRFPERVRALVLLEGGGLHVHPSTRSWLDELDEKVFEMAEADGGRVAEAMVDGALGDGAWADLPREVREIFAANGPAILAEQRGGYLDVTPDELRALAHPVLVVSAEESPGAFGEAMELVAAAIPGARLERVEGSHFIDPAHQVVLRFVEEVLALR